MATTKKKTTANKKPTVKQVKVEIDLSPKEDGTLPTTEEVVMEAKIEEVDPKVEILKEFLSYYKEKCEGKTMVEYEIGLHINELRNKYFGRTDRLGKCPACLAKIVKTMKKECAKYKLI